MVILSLTLTLSFKVLWISNWVFLNRNSYFWRLKWEERKILLLEVTLTIILTMTLKVIWRPNWFFLMRTLVFDQENNNKNSRVPQFINLVSCPHSTIEILWYYFCRSISKETALFRGITTCHSVLLSRVAGSNEPDNMPVSNGMRRGVILLTLLMFGGIVFSFFSNMKIIQQGIP